MEAEESAASLKTKEEVEADITKAMLTRLSDFKEQADNLTLEGVRRALEKDLGMERLSLDAHKKFIKQCLQKYFYGADDKDASKTEGENAEESLQPVKEAAPGQSEDHADDLKHSSSDLNEKLDRSPVLGGGELATHKTEKSDNGSEQESKINEDIIKKAMRKRAAYFRSNLEITLVKVRRLLEEDLELEKNSLDSYKKFISSELDAVLQSSETVQARNGAKKERKETPNRKNPTKTSKGTKKARMDSDSDSDSDDVSSENDEDDEEIKKPKKRPAQKVKAGVKGSKRQKISTEKSKVSTASAGKKKPVEADSEQSDESDVEKASEDDRSQSSGEEEIKKKTEKPAQIYGKRVEQLKSTIKSCGMSVPPSVYKRVKQAPESKREAHLIKELEEILEKEGLSANPSEKEIKSVKKRKERAKELEGIDMSNIVSSSRRRTTGFIPPPKPKIEAESDESGEGEEDEEDEENEEDSDDGNNDGEESSQGSDDDDAEEESD